MHLVNCSNYEPVAGDCNNGGLSLEGLRSWRPILANGELKAIHQPHGQVVARGGTANTWR